MRTPFSFKLFTILIAIVISYAWIKSFEILMSILVDNHQYPTSSVKLTAASFFFVCIIAPLWEELAFRHLPAKIAITINPQLLWPVLLMSCIIFGFGHGNGVMSLLNQGVVGLSFTWVYIINKNSYWSSVTTHSLWNLLYFYIQ